jgi:mannose-1-phosphate guanylyltransferase
MAATAERYAVILAGGGGTRLWPSSRRTRPKQLLKLGGPESLLAATARRVLPIFGWSRILVVTARDQEQAVRRELRELPRDNLVVEPEPRNTAGAIGIAAALAAARGGWQTRLAILPADHDIADEPGFRKTVRLALAHAGDAIVTIGIRPASPETGYGYIRLGAGRGPIVRVAAFVEKPDHATAVRYLRSGRYVWNAGMFFLTAGHMLDEAAQHLPRLHRLMERLSADQRPAHFRRALGRGYREVEAISIDYGVMEKAAGLMVIPASFGWSDLGSWAAVAERAKHLRIRDRDGNVAVGDVLLEDAAENVVVADSGAPFVAVVGVRDLVVAATADGVLVIPRSRAQDVRLVVDALKAAKRRELLD